MKIFIVYNTTFGNGKKMTEHLKVVLAGKGHEVTLASFREADPQSLPQADLYVFSSNTRMGSPPSRTKKFLKSLTIGKGANYALMATHMDPNATTVKKMDAFLKPKGMTKVADGLQVMVKGLKGPLEDGWEQKVEAFASELSG